MILTVCLLYCRYRNYPPELLVDIIARIDLRGFDLEGFEWIDGGKDGNEG